MREQLHSADFGSAGDGAAGKEGAEDVLEADFGAELAGDGGGHLPEGGVALDGEEVVDLDGTEGTEAAEIVAEQVDDHYVFGAVFGVVAEPVGEGAVFGGGAAAGGGAFHGAGGDAAALSCGFRLLRFGEIGMINGARGGCGFPPLR